MVVTSDPGVAHAWLRTTFPGYLPEETNSRRDFLFQAVHEQAGRSGVSRLRYSLSADNNVASDVILVVRPSAGTRLTGWAARSGIEPAPNRHQWPPQWHQKRLRPPSRRRTAWSQGWS